MSAKTSKLVLNARTSAEVYPAVNMDSRYSENCVVGVAGTLTNTDTIMVLVSPNMADVSAAVDVWVTVATFTSVAFAGTVEGPWPRMAIKKTGTAGAATVYIVG